MLTRTEITQAVYKHLLSSGCSLPEPECGACVDRGIDFTKGLIISNAFKKHDLEFVIEKFLEETTETSAFYLAAAQDGSLERFVLAMTDTAKAEIDDSGSAKILSVADVDSDVLSLYEKGFDPGITTDWLNLNKFYRAAKRQLCVVTGMGGIGKSTWLENYLIQVAIKTNWKFCFYSPENYPVAYHVEKLMSTYAGKPFYEGMIERMQPAELGDAMAWVNKHFLFISSDDNATLDVCLNVFRRAIDEHAVDGVIIDPWNTVEKKSNKDQSETEYICESLTKCIGFTRRKNIAMWIVAHPAKPRRDRDGNFPPMNLYDISGSAHWANRPDAGLSVHRREDGITEVTVHKMRFRMYGGTGSVEFGFDKPCNRFTECKENSNDTPF